MNYILYWKTFKDNYSNMIVIQKSLNKIQIVNGF